MGVSIMNYIEQLNSFYDLQEQHPISIKAFCLYHHLLHINNKLFWRERFVLPNSRLVNLTGLDIRTFDRVRNELIQKGLIEYKKGKGSQAGEYKIVKLYAQNDRQNDLCVQNDIQIESSAQFDIQNDRQFDIQNDRQIDNINKTENEDIYINLLNNARKKFDVSTFGEKIKAQAWAKEQPEWNEISSEEQLWFIKKL